jgi:hypothetical protein
MDPPPALGGAGKVSPRWRGVWVAMGSWDAASHVAAHPAIRARRSVVERAGKHERVCLGTAATRRKYPAASTPRDALVERPRA